MSQRDFTTESLAEYLHLSPAQVARLAERENIPGRKVAGQWKFSAADVHHWLERRLGLLEEESQEHVENVLSRSAPQGEVGVSLEQLLPREAVGVPLAARTRRGVIDAMVELAAHTGQLWDAAAMTAAVLAREELQPTAMDNGVALLHPRRPLAGALGEPLITLGVSGQGIPFGGAGGRLTDVFFLICSTDDRGHLRTLARLTRVLGDESLLPALRSAATPAEARDALLRAEAKLFS